MTSILNFKNGPADENGRPNGHKHVFQAERREHRLPEKGHLVIKHRSLEVENLVDASDTGGSFCMAHGRLM